MTLATLASHFNKGFVDMPRLHISQDDTGFWQLSMEADDGTLTLLAHQFLTPDHLIEDAREIVDEGRVPGAVILVGPRRGPTLPQLRLAAASTQDYREPAPRKAE